MFPSTSCEKPFLTIPEQIQRLRERGMDCRDDVYAASVLQRYGYYRLSGYWHLYRKWPKSPSSRSTADGREIRLNDFERGTSLEQVVFLYEFDQKLRTRLNSVIAVIEAAFRFCIGHRLGRIDPFAHRRPDLLGGAAMEARNCYLTHAWSAPPRLVPKADYREWLQRYEREEKRAQDDFVAHFRQKYGPHLPIWVATEVMSFATLANLTNLMASRDQEILAARFQIRSQNGAGDYGVLRSWLKNLRRARNICAHHGRLWNRRFDILQLPGEVSKATNHILAPLTDDRVKNKLYGLLLIIRYLMLSIDPTRYEVLDLLDFIDLESRKGFFELRQLGFPDDWRHHRIWEREYELDGRAMAAASLLDRVETLSAAEARSALTDANELAGKKGNMPLSENGKKAAQRSLLRAYRKYRVLIEIELGETRFYPSFQFRHGKVINALAEVNQTISLACSDMDSVSIAKILLDWWQSSNSALPHKRDGTYYSPIEYLNSVSEEIFEAAIKELDLSCIFPSS